MLCNGGLECAPSKAMNAWIRRKKGFGSFVESRGRRFRVFSLNKIKGAFKGKTLQLDDPPSQKKGLVQGFDGLALSHPLDAPLQSLASCRPKVEVPRERRRGLSFGRDSLLLYIGFDTCCHRNVPHKQHIFSELCFDTADSHSKAREVCRRFIVAKFSSRLVVFLLCLEH